MNNTTKENKELINELEKCLAKIAQSQKIAEQARKSIFKLIDSYEQDSKRTS